MPLQPGSGARMAGTSFRTVVSHPRMDAHYQGYFAATAAMSSAGAFAIAAGLTCALLLVALLRQFAWKTAIPAIAAILALPLTACLLCNRLRSDALRHAIQFTPYLTADGGTTTLVAGYDPRKFRPVIITDWPSDYRACPPMLGALRGVLMDTYGKSVPELSVCVFPDDNGLVVHIGPDRCQTTDLQGHFRIEYLTLGRYRLYATQKHGATNLLTPSEVTLGPANRFPTIDLILHSSIPR